MEKLDIAQKRSLTAEQLHFGARAYPEEIEGKGTLHTNPLYADLTTFAKDEVQRRKETPIYIDGDLVKREHQEVDAVFIVDPRMGFTNNTHRFWISNLPGGGEEAQKWHTIGHRHTVEAIILWMDGYGYSVIDGKRYDWEAGDFVSVPLFAWHRHVNLSDERVRYAASTTGPLMMAIGQAVYEDENYPDLWVFAQQSDEAKGTLIPGGVDMGKWDPSEYDAQPAQLYLEDVSFASKEEAERRKSRIVMKAGDLEYGDTPMGRLAYVADSRVGFHQKVLDARVGEVLAGGRSGAHRHLYDEIDLVLSGTGQATVDDITFNIKEGDTLAIPPFAWHQYFNTGDEPLRVLAFSTKPMLENLGLSLVQQGEVATT